MLVILNDNRDIFIQFVFPRSMYCGSPVFDRKYKMDVNIGICVCHQNLWGGPYGTKGLHFQLRSSNMGDPYGTTLSLRIFFRSFIEVVPTGPGGIAFITGFYRGNPYEDHEDGHLCATEASYNLAATTMLSFSLMRSPTALKASIQTM